MPLYSYRCIKCQSKFDFSHSLNDKSPKCPVCNIEMNRIISPVTSIFLGNGWGKDAR